MRTHVDQFCGWAELGDYAGTQCQQSEDGSRLRSAAKSHRTSDTPSGSTPERKCGQCCCARGHRNPWSDHSGSESWRSSGSASLARRTGQPPDRQQHQYEGVTDLADKRAAAVAPQIGAVRTIEPRLQHRHRRLICVQHRSSQQSCFQCIDERPQSHAAGVPFVNVESIVSDQVSRASGASGREMT
jgi:hypothetical protein